MAEFNVENIKTFTELYLKIHYPEFLEYLNSKYPEYLATQEKAYWYKNNISKRPLCPVCGKPLKFMCMSVGYNKSCSRECTEKNQEYLNKIRKTNLERYGSENVFSSEKIKERIRQSNLKKYGTEYSSQNKEVKEKIKKTNLEKYGVTCTVHNPEVLKKVKKTNLERYGTEEVFSSEMIKKKIKITNTKKYGGMGWGSKCIKEKTLNSYKKSFLLKYPDIINVTYNGGQANTIYTCTCPHENCVQCKEKKYDINSLVYWVRKNNNSELCTKLLPIAKNNIKDTSIELFIQKLLNEYNIKYINNDKTILLNKKELDIYIPSCNLAIECNGVFWHSTYRKDPKYHNLKYKECSNKGIQLLTIWEDWILRKPEIVKSIILSKLGIYKEKIYARKCTIKEVDTKICRDFLNENHIQGNSSSSKKIGLFYEGSLVSLMTFGKRKTIMGNKRYSAEDEWELIRFCNKLDIQVIGGASKLLNYFIKNYNPKNIISFSSNDISNGRLYETLGFNHESSSDSSYWYIDQEYNRYHRFTFSKQSLKRKGYDISNKTESELMQELGYFKIYDTGQNKYIWSKKESQY